MGKGVEFFGSKSEYFGIGVELGFWEKESSFWGLKVSIFFRFGVGEVMRVRKRANVTR